MIDENTMRSMGGKAATANLTPEERSRRSRKAMRTMGKEGRSARARKGWETRKQNTQANRATIDRLVGAMAGEEGYPSRPATEPGGKPLNITPKPKRAIPRNGTNNREVYDAVSIEPRSAENIAFFTELGMREVSNALSSLRSGGHVVSEGPGRVKLWRLA